MKTENKKKSVNKNGAPSGLVEAIVAVGIFVAVILSIVIIKICAPAEGTPEPPVDTTVHEAAQPELLSADITLPMQLTDGISLTGVYAADALFPEDGSNAECDNLICAALKNTSDKTLEYMTFALQCGEETYEFSVTTLPPSAEVYVFEKNAARAPEHIDEMTAETQIKLFFAEEPTLMEDALEITVRNGNIDIKNITDVPIDREIQVYYKNTEGGAYFGGITYFLRVPAGLKPGEVYCGYAANASAARTEVMFVKYGN